MFDEELSQVIPPRGGHGAFLFWAKELIQDFIRRINQLTITFKLCRVSPEDLPRMM